MKYKTLLFDADMTLFDFKASEAQCLKQTLEEYGFPHNEQTLALYSRINDSYWKRFEHREISRSALLTARFDDFFRELGVNGNSAEFNRRYLENMGESALLLNGAEELCRDLCQTHRLYIITNGNSRNQRRRFEKSGFNQYFLDYFISEEIGCQKPQTAFFDYVREHMPDWDADSTLVIGDSLSSDIQGAINYALDCCWFNPDKLNYALSQTCTYEIYRLEQLKSILFEK